jgi:putative pyoverdin transport system ATP-binding/permease protein
MSLLGLMLRGSWRVTAGAAAASLGGGACAAALIAFINQMLNKDRIGVGALGVFGLLVAGKVAGSSSARWFLNRMVQRAVVDLRHDLSQRIIKAPLWQLEQAGPARLRSVLVEDVMAITTALAALPTLAANLAILGGCFVYLGLLSAPMLFALIGVVVVGWAGYEVLRRYAMKSLREARIEHDRLVSFFHGLAEGCKELQLNRDLRRTFLAEDMEPAAEIVRRHAVRAEECFIILESWTQVLFYLLVATILFALPSWRHVESSVLTGYVLTVLFMMRPIVSILQLLPSLSNGTVAIGHLERLSSALAVPNETVSQAVHDSRWRPFTVLELVGITYVHPGNDDAFQLGPVDLSFVPGELVFLVGGNGSGKSTLAKLVAGLYSPKDGEVLLNGIPVCDGQRDDYRQLFSAVFVDSYLFGRVTSHTDLHRLAQAQRYLTEFRLDHKVRVKDGVFCTSGLSQGEKKRLALVTAYLDDRPFYIFDEWAANQDPQFKEVFYWRLLPDLTARGKTVLVISHDDRYFAAADRVIRLEEGNIVWEQQVSSEAL